MLKPLDCYITNGIRENAEMKILYEFGDMFMYLFKELIVPIIIRLPNKHQISESVGGKC